ncbi:Sec-independent protein translocase protein TatB [Paraburkholderia sp.]|uniref:Sec-independent protein translocase protein TatB n=1 Tax=Paraburkholderia sp. TaxID=1926495 RepID=UPI002F41ABBB
MFDFDISKMAVIGTVALVVLGPERLPRVARTAGTLLGRAQRYISNVQAEVDQQIRMDDLRKIKDGVEQAAADVQRSIDRTVRQQAGELQAGVDAAAASVREVLPATYLPSIHESAGDLQTELFKVRPAPLQASTQASAALASPRLDGDVVAPMASGVAGQARTRANWRGNASAGRRGPLKRSRIVSMAASKALGRDAGRLA